MTAPNWLQQQTDRIEKQIGDYNRSLQDSRIKRIHVNQHVLKDNRKTGQTNPVLTIKTSDANHYAREVEILGPSRVVYRPERPLPCGAVCWIETEAEVVILG